METTRLNVSYVLPLQKTKRVNAESEINNVPQSINHTCFVICNSCYWSTTIFGIDNLSLSHVINCHACNSHNTELIPIEPDESFRIDNSHARGMEIEFYNNRK
jgi:hypothetical protein